MPDIKAVNKKCINKNKYKQRVKSYTRPGFPSASLLALVLFQYLFLFSHTQEHGGRKELFGDLKFEMESVKSGHPQVEGVACSTSVQSISCRNYLQSVAESGQLNAIANVY